MNDNRRSVPRAKLDLLFNAFQGGLPAVCAAIDLSEGGLGLRQLSDTRNVSDESIEVECSLPGVDRGISATGRLRVGHASAVVFESIEAGDLMLIREFVSAT